jgi:hypothetical protein
MRRFMTSPRLRLWISLGLAALVLLIYSGVWQAEFVEYDDPLHVVTNEHVREGLTAANVAWAFTHWHAAQWIPLTWISHMLDVSLFGMDPGPHHLVNVAFHLANVLLLFSVLLRMTGRLWPSAAVAALFAAHPLNVESVAWISERKNVLNTLCWLLALLCYARYAAKSRLGWLAGAVFCMAAGVMSKAMIVTLPFVLLLLDGWPLGSFATTSWRRLVLEKLPFFALSAFGCWAQISAGAQVQLLWTREASPISYRLTCAAANTLLYLTQIFIPVQLALPYPMARTAPYGLALVSLVVFSGLLFWAWRRRATAPYALFGLLWFLGILTPVSGIVQAGDTAFANRYAYVPQIGIFIAVAWSLEAWLRHKNRLVLPALATAFLCLFTFLSVRYVACWENTATLFTHAAAVLPTSLKAQGNAALGLVHQRRLPESLPYFRAALAIEPHNAAFRGDYGLALSKLGDLDGAIAQFRLAAADDSRPAVAAFNLGTHLLRKGQPAEATPVLEAVTRTNPGDPLSHYWLGRAYEAGGRAPAALREYREAAALNPGDASIQEAVRRLAGE